MCKKQGHLSRMCCISELVIMKMAWQITLSCLWLCLQFVRDSPLPFGTNSRDSCGAATVLSCATFAYGKQFGIKCVTMEELWPKSQDRLLVLPHCYWLLEMWNLTQDQLNIPVLFARSQFAVTSGQCLVTGVKCEVSEATYLK